jgi:uncharacterized protein
MKVTGEATVGAPAETVWAALHDRAVLARAVPGCERLEIIGPGSGRFIVTTTMTAISGTYSGQLTASGQQQPSSVDLTASAAGSQGTVTADLAIRLTPADGGATLVGYEANGVVSGALAGVGARLLASAAKRLADEFLAALDEVIAGPAPVASTTPEQAVEDASTEVVAEPRVEPSPESKSPALDTSGAVASRLDLKLGALVAAAILLLGVAVGILAGRRGRARASRS